MTSAFKAGITVRTTKHYPRVTCGPLRHQYVHRVVAAALVGRELKRDEEVHHRDGDKRNFWFTNLHVMGGEDHGWVSALQAWFMRNKDALLKKEWDEFMDEEYKRFQKEATTAKATGKPWDGKDGQMAKRWSARQAS